LIFPNLKETLEISRMWRASHQLVGNKLVANGSQEPFERGDVKRVFLYPSQKIRVSVFLNGSVM